MPPSVQRLPRTSPFSRRLLARNFNGSRYRHIAERCECGARVHRPTGLRGAGVLFAGVGAIGFFWAVLRFSRQAGQNTALRLTVENCAPHGQVTSRGLGRKSHGIPSFPPVQPVTLAPECSDASRAARASVPGGSGDWCRGSLAHKEGVCGLWAIRIIRPAARVLGH